MRWLGLAVALAVAALVGLTGWGVHVVHAPGEADAPTQVFTVSEGESLYTVSRRLAEAGLVREHAPFGPRALVWYAQLRGMDRGVKAGEYELSASLSATEILERLVAGNVMTHAVTLPEGLRIDEVGVRLEAAGITPADAFVAAATNAERARAAGLPADSFEGYLYPETYRFRRDTPADEVVATLHAEFQTRLAPLLAQVERAPMSLHQVVTLASIVEKETAVPAERGIIAGVFHNRLERGMRLQSDPTVIYGVIHTEGHFDGDIRSRDLQADNPYNTYTRGGLPPGPIASTTVDSIRAVLEPDDVPYLYFVSKNDGTHTFSRTLAEHNRAVNQYQKRRRPLDPS